VFLLKTVIVQEMEKKAQAESIVDRLLVEGQPTNNVKDLDDDVVVSKWEVHIDQDGEREYINAETQEATHEIPDGYASDDSVIYVESKLPLTPRTKNTSPPRETRAMPPSPPPLPSSPPRITIEQEEGEEEVTVVEDKPVTEDIPVVAPIVNRDRSKSGSYKVKADGKLITKGRQGEGVVMHQFAWQKKFNGMSPHSLTSIDDQVDEILASSPPASPVHSRTKLKPNLADYTTRRGEEETTTETCDARVRSKPDLATMAARDRRTADDAKSSRCTKRKETPFDKARLATAMARDTRKPSPEPETHVTIEFCDDVIEGTTNSATKRDPKSIEEVASRDTRKPPAPQKLPPPPPPQAPPQA